MKGQATGTGSGWTCIQFCGAGIADICQGRVMIILGSRARVAFFGALVASLAAAGTAGAQQQGDGFLFGAPHGTFTVRAGYAAAAAKGSLVDFTTTNLTLNRSDFSSPAVS